MLCNISPLNSLVSANVGFVTQSGFGIDFLLFKMIQTAILQGVSFVCIVPLVIQFLRLMTLLGTCNLTL